MKISYDDSLTADEKADKIMTIAREGKNCGGHMIVEKFRRIIKQIFTINGKPDPMAYFFLIVTLIALCFGLWRLLYEYME